jgi:hypothetical protein
MTMASRQKSSRDAAPAAAFKTFTATGLHTTHRIDARVQFIAHHNAPLPLVASRQYFFNIHSPVENAFVDVAILAGIQKPREHEMLGWNLCGPRD